MLYYCYATRFEVCGFQAFACLAGGRRGGGAWLCYAMIFDVMRFPNVRGIGQGGRKETKRGEEGEGIVSCCHLSLCYQRENKWCQVFVATSQPAEGTKRRRIPGARGAGGGRGEKEARDPACGRVLRGEEFGWMDGMWGAGGGAREGMARGISNTPRSPHHHPPPPPREKWGRRAGGGRKGWGEDCLTAA